MDESSKERDNLPERIALGDHVKIDPGIDEAWRQLTRLRVAEIDAGTAKGEPLDDVFAEARRMIGLWR